MRNATCERDMHAFGRDVYFEDATTMTELTVSVDANSRLLLTHPGIKSVGVSAGVELFKRFLNATSMDFTELDACKAQLMSRGELFVRKSETCKQQIGRFASQFIRDGTVILVHSYSRVVISLLKQAAKMNKRFTIYLTESRPKCSGYNAAKVLREAGIPVTVILDCAVGYFMDKVDIVLVGAEGVMENGGIINQVGTYQIAVVAHAANKPFYAVVESFKFVRYFPLNQYDMPSVVSSPRPMINSDESTRPQEESVSSAASASALLSGSVPTASASASVLIESASSTAAPAHSSLHGSVGRPSEHPDDNISETNPSVDYTPPKFITLLFTDLGVLTPSAVGDELIKLYY